MPFQLAGIRVERNDAVTVKVVAEPRGPVPVRRRIAGAEEHEVRFLVVGAGIPDADAAGLPRLAGPGLVAVLARSRNRVEAPRLLAALRVVGGDEAAYRR